jgi:hypothetical protein
VPALEPALGGELVVGLLGHAPRDLEVGGQGAGAGKPPADREGPGDDLLAHAVSQLARQRDAGDAVEDEGDRLGARHECPVRIVLKWLGPAGHFPGILGP